MAVYEFEEGLSSASTPTYPDAVRRNSFGAADLYEPNGIDVGAGSTLAGYDNGKLGTGITGYVQPDSISSLTLWVRADQIGGADGDLVATWSDQSGNGNNLTAAGGNRPTLKTGILNSEPVVRFNGSNDLTGPALSAILTNTSYTAFVVYRSTAVGSVLVAMGGSMVGLRVAQNTRETFSITWAFTSLGAGSYEIGMCGAAITTPTNWNSNDYGYITAFVIN